MGKNAIDSFSFPVEELVILEKFVKIAQREGKSKSKLIMELVKQYIKEHGDGNPNYELKKWVDQDDFKVTPAFFESNEKWDHYMDQCNRKELSSIEGRAHYLKEGSRKRWRDLK